MITVVEQEFYNVSYNRCLELSDWRFSASAVGLIRFFEHCSLKYYKAKRKLYYNFEDIDLTQKEVQDNYSRFAEFWFSELMHHMSLAELYEKRNLSDDDKKIINEKLAANSILKKVFKGIKYGDLTPEEIKHRIAENKSDIILSTFVNSINGYRKYATISCFSKESQDCCRLLGHYVDIGRKTKSLGFNFDKLAATFTDKIEFDFIPFAFSKGRESIFVNNNTNLSRLLESNNIVKAYFDKLVDKNASWNNIFYNFLNSSRFIRQDTEIIMKKVEMDYYETVFVRKPAIDTFIEISKKNTVDNLSSLDMLLKRHIKVNENYYLNISELITKSILNGTLLDDLIERIFKIESVGRDGIRYAFVIGQLIRINTVVYKNFYSLEVEMDSEKYLKGAYLSAKDVTRYFKDMNLDNKTNGYRQKLISCIIAKDYDRFIEIMLQLSSYTQKSFSFMHMLIKDFEANKNLAYEFINSLGDYNKPVSSDNNTTKEGKKNEK
ncbi:MAG: type I CRISPR-associated protein Cas8a1/Csx8 [[Eubacterium] sulci]|nr:type I CRISPR-associated protein Cas8a1/Csx8 [Parvimonas sp.]MBF1161154.1 type I CRISPR-associated protein Cas8a1/Csx8 [[Eubacterium] sulci]